MPMKWHNFLCKFLLWLGVLGNAISGFGMFALSGELSRGGGIFTFLGILMLGIAVLGILTAVWLIKFDARGITCVKILYGINAASSLIALFTEFSGSNVVSLITAIVMLVVNSIYYGNRRDMFH